jgi:hypothetical protein
VQGTGKYNDGSDSNNANDNRVVTSFTRKKFVSLEKE